MNTFHLCNMKLHIGEIIKEIAKRKRLGPTEFGNLINTSKQNIYGIYKRPSIDTELLHKISVALDHNFFKYYLENTSQEIVNEDPVPYGTNIKTLTRLKTELSICIDSKTILEQENTYLKEIVSLLKQKE